MDSHSIGLIRDLDCEGDKGYGTACLDAMIGERSESDLRTIVGGDIGHGCSGMNCSDDGRLLDSELDWHSIGLIHEPSCEGDRGLDC